MIMAICTSRLHAVTARFILETVEKAAHLNGPIKDDRRLHFAEMLDSDFLESGPLNPAASETRIRRSLTSNHMWIRL